MGPDLLAQWRANNPGQPDPVVNDTPGRSGNPGAAVGHQDVFTAPGASRPAQVYPAAPTRPTTGGGYPVPSLAGLSNQASGGQSMQTMAMAPQSLPSAPGMSMAQPTQMPSMVANPNMKRKAKGGLGALANQASGMGMMQKPNLTYG